MGFVSNKLTEFLADDLEPGEVIVASCVDVHASGGMTKIALTNGTVARNDASPIPHGAILVVTDRRLLVVATKVGGRRPERVATELRLSELRAERGVKKMMLIKVPTLAITAHGAEPVVFEAPKARSKDLAAVAAALGC